MKNTIFIRVDSSTKIGYGHFIRCMALADTLQKNFKINFISRSLEGSLISDIQDKRFGIFRFYSNSEKIDEKNDAQKTISLIKKHSGQKNILIIDNYQLSKKWETYVKPFVHKLIVIDDLSNRSHNCDLLIDQNLHTKVNGLYKGLIPSNCIKLIGPKFSMIRKKFRMLKKSVKPRTFPIKKILVSFGGSDPTNECKKALDALCSIENSKFEIIVAAGIYNHKFEQLKKLYEKYSNIKIYRHVDELSRLMVNSDLFIGAGGTTTWERFYMGLPSIVTIISDDQKESIEFLSDMGHVINLGLAKNVTSKTYVQTLQKPNSDLIYDMSLHNQKLVDGNGSNRIKKQIIELINDA